MNKNILILALLIFLSCKKTEPNKKTSLHITGMTCQEGCGNFIQSKLYKIKGISNAEVSFKKETAKIYFDSTEINEKKMIEIIQNIGDYKASIK